jgi:hypothetical protein
MSVVRSGVKLGGAWLVHHGFQTQSQATFWSGFAVVAVGVLWSAWTAYWKQHQILGH